MARYLERLEPLMPRCKRFGEDYYRNYPTMREYHTSPSCFGAKCLSGKLSAIAGKTILWRSPWHLSLEQCSHSPGLTVLPQFKKDQTVAN